MRGATPGQPLQERLPTGIPGLDAVLRGGLPPGGVYLVVGRPGTGKTILASQCCFAHVAAGGRAVYLTLLTEAHTRLLAQMRTLAFYDPAAPGDALYYLSGVRALADGGLPALLDLARHTVRERAATLLVLDGLATAGAAGSEQDLKRFLLGLQVQLETVGCTALLLGVPPGAGTAPPEQTMVDGILALHDRQAAAHDERLLEVVKCRGTAYLRGRHSYEITPAGLAVHPRTEALYAAPPAETPAGSGRLPFGVPGLDAMLGGGPPGGSATLLLGPPGAGKTLVGLHFLAAGAHAGERGLHFGCYEPPPQLVAKADGLGLGLGDALGRGLLELVWQPPVGTGLDALAGRLLAAVARHRPARLVVDGLDGFVHAALAPARLPRFLAALLHELRARGVTTVAVHEQPEFFGPAAPVPIDGSAELMDSILFLRTVELGSHLRRTIAVLKLSEGERDPAIRELWLTPRGIDVAGPLASAEAILTGVARPRPAAADPAPAPPEDARDADDPGRGR